MIQREFCFSIQEEVFRSDTLEAAKGGPLRLRAPRDHSTSQPQAWVFWKESIPFLFVVSMNLEQNLIMWKFLIKLPKYPHKFHYMHWS